MVGTRYPDKQYQFGALQGKRNKEEKEGKNHSQCEQQMFVYSLSYYSYILP